MRTRLALFAAALPLAFYAYACSSDDDADPGEDAGADTSRPQTDSSTPQPDGSPPPPPPPPVDGGTDAGDGGTDAGPTCIGNPLTADGGTTDGGVALDAGVAMQIVTAQGAFVDGPQWFEGLGLVYSEVFNGNVRRVAADGGAPATLRAVANVGLQRPVGNAVRNGVLLTAIVRNDQAGQATIWQTQPDGGALPNISPGTATAPNDLAVAANGTVYFTNPPYFGNANNAVFATLPDGGGAASFTNYTQGEEPNGIALSPDGKTLYVAFTNLRQIVKHSLAGDGGIGAAQVVVPNNGTIDQPDGIAVDVAGNLWVAEAAQAGQSGRVEVFSPTGQKWGEIPFPNQRPTGVAFGGADNKTVFITVENGVFVYASRCAGVR